MIQDLVLQSGFNFLVRLEVLLGLEIIIIV